jgi:hypothetical protein
VGTTGRRSNEPTTIVSLQDAAFVGWFFFAGRVRQTTKQHIRIRSRCIEGPTQAHDQPTLPQRALEKTPSSFVSTRVVISTAFRACVAAVVMARDDMRSKPTRMEHVAEGK